MTARLVTEWDFPRTLNVFGCLDSAVWPALPVWPALLITPRFSRIRLAVVLAVELCLSRGQRDDVSVANMISTGLFGDGAAAAVIAGHEPIFSRTGSLQQIRVYPGSET